MAAHTISQRLHNGDALLLDGGTGSELQRRGADVLKGAADRLKAWSATANLEYADVVQSGALRLPPRRGRHHHQQQLLDDAYPARLYRRAPRLAHLCDRRGPQRRRGPQCYAPRGVRRRRHRRPQPPGIDVTYQPSLRRPRLGSRGVPQGVDRPRQAPSRRGCRPDPGRVRRLHRGLRRGCRRLCRGGRAGLP